MTTDSFDQHLEHASSVVKTWPVWKQKLLGGKAQPMTTDPIIIAEDRAAAEEIARRTTTPWCHTHFMATIIARYRGKREDDLKRRILTLLPVVEAAKRFEHAEHIRESQESGDWHRDNPADAEKIRADAETELISLARSVPVVPNDDLVTEREKRLVEALIPFAAEAVRSKGHHPETKAGFFVQEPIVVSYRNCQNAHKALSEAGYEQ